MQKLDRALGLFPATTLVIGSVIGSGIFVSTADMARTLPSGSQLMAIWVFTGLMTVLGALTQCEIAARMPVTGGLYAYFRQMFGERVGFCYGWANFMIAGSGAIAAIAYILASYLGEFIPLWQPSEAVQHWAIQIPYLGTLYPGAGLGQKLVGSAFILALTALNARGVRLGSLVQSVSTSAKVLAIVIVVAAAFALGKGDWTHLSRAASEPSTAPGSMLGLGALWFAAMGGAFWSYDGWGNVAYIGGEIRDAKRTLPRAILLGIGAVITVYLLVNLAYLYVLPMGAIGAAKDDRVASAVMNAVMGPAGARLVAALIILSTFDTLNSSILCNGRVYFAMATEKLFPAAAAKVHPKHQTPAVALWLQGSWSVLLLVSGSFDLITSMYVFVNWLFYFLIPIALFVLRRRQPRTDDSTFTVPFYPWVPLAFAAFTLVYVVQTLVGDVQAYQLGKQPCVKSAMGLLLVFSGLPLYLWLRASAPGRATRARLGTS